MTVFDHVPAALLVVFRISGLMLTAPVFAAPAIPPPLKAYLCLVLGLAAFPLAATGPVEGSLWTLVPMAALEMAVGAAVGFLANLPLVAVQIGGLLMGQQMGLGFARFFDPAIDDESDVLGQVLFYTALAGFLAIGGHEAMVLAVLRGFEHLPVPAAAGLGAAEGAGLLALGLGLLTSAIELALRVAAPLLMLVFLETVAMGFLARTAPQFNVLSMGFALRILGGLGVVILGLAVMDEIVMELMSDTVERILAWSGGP
jgi:flagellar biosynthetic protein FliR